MFFHAFNTALNKGPTSKLLSVKVELFSYSSGLTCVLGAQKSCLIERVLLSTHNIFFD